MKTSHLTSAAVGGMSRDTPVVLPIASMEQHGSHLPLLTDSLLLGEIVRRAESAMPGAVLFAPVLWLGNSQHHADFPGTISASPRVYLDLLCDLVESVLSHGFRRILLLNGHGGNSVPAQQALFEVRQRHRRRDDLLLLLANYWSLGSRPASTIAGITQQQIQHACQWETSMMLRLRPELVGNLSDLEPTEYGNPFQPAHRASTIRDVCPGGYVGDPRSASAEIGEALFATYSDDVVSLLRRMIDWDGSSWSG